MNPFHDQKNVLYCFVLKLVDHLCLMQKGGRCCGRRCCGGKVLWEEVLWGEGVVGGRGCGGGKGRGFIKFNVMFVCVL